MIVDVALPIPVSKNIFIYCPGQMETLREEIFAP